MGKLIRRVIAVLLAVTAVILICLPGTDTQALTENGDYIMDGSTIAGYNGSETNLSIPDTVTAIGKSAFSDCNSLESVTIPDTVTVIDYAAFENCKNLQRVVIPESVKTIGSSAFSGCESLSDINIPSKVSKIGSAAFAKCSSLSNISVSSDSEYYLCKDGVLYTKDGKKLVQYLAGRTLSTYSMPSSVTEIEEYAFWGANLLTGVSISGNVKTIPEYAFDNCSGLTTVTLPSSVTSLEAYSFGDCTNLQTITIPESVSYIDDKAFYCSNDMQIQFTDTPVVSSDSISGNNQTTGTDETEGISKTESGNEAETVLPGELGSGIIVGGSAVLLMSAAMPVQGFEIDDAEVEDSVAASGSNTTFSSDQYDMISGVLVNYAGTDTDVVIPSGINKVGNRLFYKNENIQKAELPATVTDIGDFAFARSSIKQISIPDGTEYIGYAAFYHCEDLTDVTIPSSVKQIELGAFEGSAWLHNWKNESDGDSFLVVGDGILLAYKGEGGNIYIPDSVKSIGAGCFEGNTSITGVTIPDSVTMIGEDAFNGCSALTSVQLPANLVTIEDRAFKNTGLSEIQIPTAVESLGLGAFDNTDNGNPLQVVLFAGSDLPDVSSKPTASRLSAKELRSMVFEGVENTVVTNDCDLDSGTILDTNSYGFRGQIYCITADAATEYGTLELQRVTKEPDSSSGMVTIDPHVMIGSSEYIMSSVKEHAFDAYETCEDWSGQCVTGITIEGNTSESLSSLLAGLSFSQSAGESSASAVTEDNAITVTMDASGFSEEDVQKAAAKIPESTERYLLNIKQDESVRSKLNLAFYNYYGQTGDITMVPLNISMTEQTGTIPIKKLATGKMEITIPIPVKFMGMTGLKVGAVDDNGALEVLSAQQVTKDGTECLRFVASHLSPYAVYRINTETQANADGSETVVETEQTQGFVRNQVAGVVRILNKKAGSIETKWFVIVILFSAAAILFLWGDRKQSRRGKH